MKRVRAKSVRAHMAPSVPSRAIVGRYDIDCFGRLGEFWGRLLSIMNSEKALELEGTIMSVLPGTMFRVALANEHLVLAHISGKMRKRFIRLTIGDRVRLQMSPYDIDKARIVYRL